MRMLLISWLNANHSHSIAECKSFSFPMRIVLITVWLSVYHRKTHKATLLGKFVRYFDFKKSSVVWLFVVYVFKFSLIRATQSTGLKREVNYILRKECKSLINKNRSHSQTVMQVPSLESSFKLLPSFLLCGYNNRTSDQRKQ